MFAEPCGELGLTTFGDAGQPVTIFTLANDDDLAVAFLHRAANPPGRVYDFLRGHAWLPPSSPRSCQPEAAMRSIVARATSNGTFGSKPCRRRTLPCFTVHRFAFKLSLTADACRLE